MQKTILHIIDRLPTKVLVQGSPQLLASVRTTARSRPPIYFFGDSLGLLGFGGGRQRETIEASLVFEEEEEEVLSQAIEDMTAAVCLIATVAIEILPLVWRAEQSRR